MKTSLLSLLLAFMIFGVLPTAAQTGALFTVNFTGDTTDAAPGDRVCADSNGRCSLRAAIEEANASAPFDVINFNLPTPATIAISQGELLITKPAYIVGPGARKLTLTRDVTAGSPISRIFHVAANIAGGQVSLRSLAITSGFGAGGGVYVEAGTTASLVDVSIRGNRGGLGAGVMNEGTLTVLRSTIADNGVDLQNNQGGGIYNSATGTLRIYNSTLSNNAAGEGGAIYTWGTALLVNATLAGNRSTFGASAILANGSASVSVLNTIIGPDQSPLGGALAGAFTSYGTNIVTDARNSTGFVDGVNGDRVSNENALNPLLGPLADNGGQTDTMMPQTGSIAIDAANDCVVRSGCSSPLPIFRLLTDQRGAFRGFFTAVDIGAVEAGNGGGSSTSFGTFFLNSAPRRGGELMYITVAETNFLLIRPVRPVGNFGATSQGPGVNVVEIKSKRAGRSTMFVLDPDLLTLGLAPNPADEPRAVFSTKEEPR